tara:strand:+ start:1523 stop:1756 length:234 start_codon:yes stop_codon:yes gene_type:complete
MFILCVILFNIVNINITIEPYINNFHIVGKNLYNKNYESLFKSSKIKLKYYPYTPSLDLYYNSNKNSPSPINIDDFT